jgi:hypothetical protein
MKGFPMDEITVLAAARPPAAEFPPAARAAARQQLLAAIAAERAVPRQPAGQPAAGREAAGRQPAGAQPAGRKPAGRQPATRRLLRFRRLWSPWRLGVTGAATAALCAAAILLVMLPGAPNGRSRPPAGAGRDHAPASARGLLLLAARAAVAGPSLAPRPRQFVYTEQLIVGEAYGAPGGLVKVPPYLQRTWISANGMWGGLAQVRNVSGGTWARNEPPMPVCAIPDPSNANWKANCPAPPGYMTTLPATAAGVLAYLEKLSGPNGPLAYRVLDGIASESWETRLLISNRSYALMFRAASAIHGIRVVRHVTDAAGRSGVAVAACVPGSIQKGTMSGFHGCQHRIELIFDPRTYQFIGENEVGPAEAGSPSSALLKIAVVDKAGQLP